MDSSESLSHSRWECKYHVVFISKCRRKMLYEKLRPHLGEVFRQLAEQKECRILEGHLGACGEGTSKEEDHLGSGVTRTDIIPDGGRKFTVNKEPVVIPPGQKDLIERYDKVRDAYVMAQNSIT